MIDRRSLIALGTVLPLAKRSLRLDLPDARVHPLNTGGARIISISPDGKTLVGIDNSDHLYFFKAGSNEFPVETNALPEVGVINPYSVSWSPDSSRIAFSLDAWRLMRDSDIFVADVNSGELTNVTPEGHEKEADTLMNEPDVDIDMFPVWLDDDTLLFARHKGVDSSPQLMTLSLADEGISPWINLGHAGIQYVGTPLWRLSDGSLVFSAPTDGRGRPGHRIMIISPDGEVRDVDPGGLGHIDLIHVNDTHIVANEPSTFEYWYIPLDPAEPMQNLWDRFELPGTMSMQSAPTLGPKPDTMVLVLSTERGQSVVYLYEGSESRQIAELRGEADGVICFWVDGAILVAGRKGSWLVPLT